MIEQSRCVRCGRSINNEFCSKKILKWGVLKVDDSQGNELWKDGGECCCVNNEDELSWSGER